MATILVLFNLREKADPAEYEKWAVEVDQPTVSRLNSVEHFSVHRVDRPLVGDKTPPYAYFEVIKVSDLDRFAEEIQVDPMPQVADTFQEQYADSPLFLISERVA